jgi:hypothetical protein
MPAQAAVSSTIFPELYPHVGSESKHVTNVSHVKSRLLTMIFDRFI